MKSIHFVHSQQALFFQPCCVEFNRISHNCELYWNTLQSSLEPIGFSRKLHWIRTGIHSWVENKFKQLSTTRALFVVGSTRLPLLCARNQLIKSAPFEWHSRTAMCQRFSAELIELLIFFTRLRKWVAAEFIRNAFRWKRRHPFIHREDASFSNYAARGNHFGAEMMTAYLRGLFRSFRLWPWNYLSLSLSLSLRVLSWRVLQKL